VSAPVDAFRAGFERFAEAFNAGDLVRASQGFTEDYEQVFPPGFTQESIHGREQWVRFFEDFRTDIPDWRIELGEVVELGEGLLAAEYGFKGTGRSSRVASSFDVWGLIELSGSGRIRRTVEFRSRDEAMAAARERGSAR
jgi:hypothetical protein